MDTYRVAITSNTVSTLVFRDQRDMTRLTMINSVNRYAT